MPSGISATIGIAIAVDATDGATGANASPTNARIIINRVRNARGFILEVSHVEVDMPRQIAVSFHKVI